MTMPMRMEIDEYFIKMARLVSLRGACIRRQVGCVLVNSLNHVIATGYNGRARGVTNCLEFPCKAAESDSGMDLGGCEAIHAEANALLQCKNVEEITTAYCTTAPCIHCVKLLMNTSCERIVFQDEYPHMEESERLWTMDTYECIHSNKHDSLSAINRYTKIWEHLPSQMEIFSDINESDHKHVWQKSSVSTGYENTVYMTCECGLRKEVGI